MSRLIAQMVVRNEEDRYLREVLEHTSKIVDQIVITDDHSDDNTPEICAEFGEVHRTDRNMFVENEGQLRTEAWGFLEQFAEPGDWILALDADELFFPSNRLKDWLNTKYSVLGVTFYHMWTPTHYRADAAWRPTISSRLFKFREGGKFRERALACGAEPTYVADAVRRRDFAPHTQFKMKHLGYLLDQDKQMKYERYSLLDGGKYHSRLHIESIIGQPELRQWRDDL